MNKSLRLVLLVASMAAAIGSLTTSTVFAASDTPEDPAVQFALRIGVGVGMGALISVVTVLGAESGNTWDNRKFAYGMVIAVFSAFVVIDGFKEPLNYGNIISVILQIAGGTFFANKGIQMAQRLHTKKKP